MRSGIEVARFEQRQPVPELAEAPCSSRNFARGLGGIGIGIGIIWRQRRHGE
jgi:hypothetical protein